MSVLDKKAEAALEAIAALRKHSEAVEETVKKLLLEVDGKAGNTQSVDESNGSHRSTDGLLPTPESTKAVLTKQRTVSAFGRLAEISEDSSATRLRMESAEGNVSHLTHGSTLESRAELSKSGRRIVRGTLRLKKSGTNRRPFSEILMDYGTRNIDLREDSEGGVRDTEVHDFDRKKTGGKADDLDSTTLVLNS